MGNLVVRDRNVNNPLQYCGMAPKSHAYCSVPQCKQYQEAGISFHGFPNDVPIRKKWIFALKIGKNVTKFMKVCSRHLLLTILPLGTKDSKFLTFPVKCLETYRTLSEGDL